VITRVFFGARRGDMTTEACLDHWRGTHAAIGASMPGVRAYVQNHGVLKGGRFLLPYPGFDIMPELDWDDLDVLLTIPDRPGRPPFAVQAIDVIWFAAPEDALSWTASEAAYRAAWTISGLIFGSERLIARPNKVV